MMITRTVQTVAFFLLLMAAPLAVAQPPGGMGGGENAPMTGTITGHVVDTRQDIPIEYSTIVLFSARDSSQVTGTITDKNGVFVLSGLRPGQYYADISFIGFEVNHVDSIRLGRGSLSVDLGTIHLAPSVIKMQDVDYVIERSPVEYQIDKKVVRVSKQPTAASGTAVDVLENVPSVSVDIEGNVSLRGSGNFTVLIDGRPTILDPSEALQQTPASSIDNIEIITNPSAKYDPDGTSGIINIVMKKNQVATTSGMATVSYGSFGQKSTDILVNRRNDRVNLILGGNYGERDFQGFSYSETRTTVDGVTNYNLSDGDMARTRTSYGLRGSVELNVGDRGWATFGGNWGKRSGGHDSKLSYNTWVDTVIAHTRYTSDNNSDENRNNASAFAEYRQEFGRKGHELTGRLESSWRNGDDITLTQLIDNTGAINDGRRTTESEPSRRTDIRLDYAWPHGEDQKLEAGYQLRKESSQEHNSFEMYDTGLGEYTQESRYTNRIDYDRDIHSLFAVYSGKSGNLGYQGGLRGEYEDRSIALKDTTANYALNKTDIYPSVHLSYQLPRKTQLMTSYSRRIDRPRGWFLEPFETWQDAYTVRRGNPNLDAEMIDSWEFGYQIPIGPFSHSTEFYYRVTHNLTEFVRSVYDEGVTLITVDNVGSAYDFGAEVMFAGDLARWWTVNLMGNLYNHRIDSRLAAPGVDNEDFSWSGRLSSTFKIAKTMKFQVNGIYNSPTITSQGSSEAFYMTNLAVEKTFLDRSLTAILQVRDVFQTMEHTRLAEGAGLYSYNRFSMDSPIFNITLRYNLNQFREKRQQQPTEDNGNGTEDEGDFIQ
ncbi:MAG: TonB-dependent receptor [bacterium]